ncbi:unnamed protein product, partial [Rotaria socialis]
ITLLPLSLQGQYKDINLYQTNFTIILQSSGVCVSGSFSCDLEVPAAYRDYNRKRNILSARNPTPEQIFVNTHAREICERALQSTRLSVAQLGLPPTSQTMEDGAMISCINDLELSGDKRFANSVVQLSISDSVATQKNMSEEQQNIFFEQSAEILVVAVANISASIEQFIVSENITLDTTTSTTTVSTTTVETTTTITTDSKVSTTVMTTTTSKRSEGKGLCNFYGDPHILIFGQRLNAFQHQYWCKTPGEHRILLNDFVQIYVTVHAEAWRTDQFNMTFFKDNNVALCTIADHRQICNSSDVQIIRPSISQIDIIYATGDLHISIVTHQYEFGWYDITIRMPYELIRRSSGLCVMPPVDNCELENSIEQTRKLFQRLNMNTLPRQVCEAYLVASNQAAVELGISIDSNIHDSSLSACIHDYETTGNKNFGASLVNMIIKHGINVLQPDDNSFDSYTNKSINIINAAVTNASIQVDILLTPTTETPTTKTITTTTITTTKMASTTTNTITTTTITTTVGEQSSTKSTTFSSSTTFSTTISSSVLSSTMPALIQTTTVSSYSPTTTLNSSTSSRPIYAMFVFFTSILLLKSFSSNHS